MFEFKIESPIKHIATKHLHRYQARDYHENSWHKIIACRPLEKTWNLLMEMIIALNKAGEAVGQTIECMDGSFEVHEWCLFQSNILFSFFEGMISKISNNAT